MSSFDDELNGALREEGVDPSLLELERLAAELHAKGIDFKVEQGRVVKSDSGTDRDRNLAIDLGKEHFRLGLVSDTHGGSKFEQNTALASFYRYAEDLGVDLFVHAGDMTQGPDEMHRGMVHEVHAHGADAQIDYVVQTYPKSEKPTYVITGNHDDSHLKQGGTNVVRRITQQRPDLIYVGQDAAYLSFGGLRTYVIHPDGGGTYAKSYKPQKVAESLPLDREVALLLIGHYHNYGSFRQKDTHVLMLPCFQAQYAWLARKGLHPDIGGIILDVWLDDDGRPARVAHEYVAYRPIDDDYDPAISNAISRSWSDEGLKVS